MASRVRSHYMSVDMSEGIGKLGAGSQDELKFAETRYWRSKPTLPGLSWAPVPKGQARAVICFKSRNLTILKLVRPDPLGDQLDVYTVLFSTGRISFS